jgi:hypothetical protein
MAAKDAAKTADKPQDAAAAAAPAPVKKRGGKLTMLTLVVLFCLAAPFIIPTITLFLLGMIPTFVVLFTDNDPNRSGTAAVGSMNFAGVVPFAIDLWVKGQTMDYVFHMLRDPTTWFVMFAAAAVGHLILAAIPPALTTLTLARYEVRLKALKESLEALKAAWGPDVGTTKPLDKIGQREP